MQFGSSSQAVFFKMRVAGVLHIFQFETKQVRAASQPGGRKNKAWGAAASQVVSCNLEGFLWAVPATQIAPLPKPKV